jgi:hypothetical protein
MWNGKHESTNKHHQDEISDRVLLPEASEVFSSAEHFRGRFSGPWHCHRISGATVGRSDADIRGESGFPGSQPQGIPVGCDAVASPRKGVGDGRIDGRKPMTLHSVARLTALD